MARRFDHGRVEYPDAQLAGSFEVGDNLLGTKVLSTSMRTSTLSSVRAQLQEVQSCAARRLRGAQGELVEHGGPDAYGDLLSLVEDAAGVVQFQVNAVSWGS
jgi:hypothetical protein